MKLLFAYRYLTIGGVESVIRARLENLSEIGAEAWAWFLKDGSGRSAFSNVSSRIFVGDSKEVKEFFRNRSFDVAASIDTPEVLPILSEIANAVVVEAHSPYRENLDYLRDLRSDQVKLIITPTEYQAKVVGSILRERIPIAVVPNAIDRRFLHSVNAFQATGNAPVLAWIGRLDYLKNWKGFLEVASKVVRQDGRVELLLVGSLPNDRDWPRVYRKASSLGVLGKLRWYRNFPPSKVPRLLDYVRDSGGVLISTSKGESFGMTIAEGMARACPVVVPEAAPFTEFVEHELTGLGYTEGNYAEAASMVLRLMNEDEFRSNLAQNARGYILNHFSTESTTERLVRALHGARI